MNLFRSISVLLAAALPMAAVLAAGESGTDEPESIHCYQNGALIYKTQGKIREFVPVDSMKLVGDVNIGQVTESHTKLFSTQAGNLVCVITTRK